MLACAACLNAHVIHADSIRDPDLYIATGISVVDPFTYVEIDGKRVIVTSELEADAARRNSSATDVWTGSRVRRPRADQGRDGLERLPGSRSSAAPWSKLDVTEAAVPPSFPVELADYLRGHGIAVRADRQGYEMRRRVKDERALAGIRLAQTATEAAFARVGRDARRVVAGRRRPGARRRDAHRRAA